MKIFFSFLIFSCAILLLYSSGCVYHKGEVTPSIQCDTCNFTYTKDVKKIIDKYCFGNNGDCCHSGCSYDFTTYEGLTDPLHRGDIENAILQNGKAEAMPQSPKPKLPQPEIDTIVIWLHTGFKK